MKAVFFFNRILKTALSFFKKTDRHLLVITCKLHCHFICEFHFHFSMTFTQNVHCLNLTKKAITSLLHDFTACSGGVYGQNCSLPCGQCLDNEQCHHINGTCMNGCGRGYQGLNCTEGQHLLQFTTC